MIWLGISIYLLIGASLGYWLLGLGYKHAPAPYCKPRELIKDPEDIWIIISMAFGWFIVAILLLLRCAK